MVLWAFLAGCQGTLPTAREQGKKISTAKSIPLNESGEKTGQYRTEDLTIDYRYTLAGGKFEISGILQFTNSMQLMMAAINAFSLTLVVGDRQGTVLEQQGLTTANNHQPTEPLSFTKTLTIPPNAASMAFSYTGMALGSGSEKGRASFWDVPVH
jgi:hypothetical protein